MPNEKVMNTSDDNVAITTADPYLDLSTAVLDPRRGTVEVEGWGLDAGTGLPLRTRERVLKGTGTPFWGDEPGLYDTVRFGKNILLPGVCSVEGNAFQQRIQRDETPGLHGASLKQLGRKQCKIRITVQMWTREHLDSFARLVPLLKSQRYVAKTVTTTTDADGTSIVTGTGSGRGATGYWGDAPSAAAAGGISLESVTIKRTTSVPVGPAPIDVYHPMLALFRIRTVHILAVSLPERGRGGTDVWEATIECEEHVAARQTAVKTADASQELITEQNPRIQKTAATLALESKKPSDVAASAPSRGRGVTGSW